MSIPIVSTFCIYYLTLNENEETTYIFFIIAVGRQI